MPRIRSEVPDDPQYHHRKLKKYIDGIRKDDRKAGENYEHFFNELLKIFKDSPPTSWRFLVTTYEYPVFRVVNRSTGRLNDFLRVCSDRLIVSSKFFDESLRTLFPRRKDFYGQGDAVLIDFSAFGPQRQDRYIDAIRKMVTGNSACHINFSVV